MQSSKWPPLMYKSLPPITPTQSPEVFNSYLRRLDMVTGTDCIAAPLVREFGCGCELVALCDVGAHGSVACEYHWMSFINSDTKEGLDILGYHATNEAAIKYAVCEAMARKFLRSINSLKAHPLQGDSCGQRSYTHGSTMLESIHWQECPASDTIMESSVSIEPKSQTQLSSTLTQMNSTSENEKIQSSPRSDPKVTQRQKSEIFVFEKQEESTKLPLTHHSTLQDSSVSRSIPVVASDSQKTSGSVTDWNVELLSTISSEASPKQAMKAFNAEKNENFMHLPDLKCVLCQVTKAQVAFLPCSHCVLCAACLEIFSLQSSNGKRKQICLVCRTPIQSISKPTPAFYIRPRVYPACLFT